MWERLQTNEKELLKTYCFKQIKYTKITITLIQCIILCIALYNIYSAFCKQTDWFTAISILLGVFLTELCLYTIKHEYILPTKYITQNLARTRLVKPINKRIHQEKWLFWTINRYEVYVTIQENNVPTSYWVQTTKALYDTLDKYQKIRIIQLIPNNYRYMIACDAQMKTLF